jgi:hypothetical protein
MMSLRPESSGPFLTRDCCYILNFHVLAQTNRCLPETSRRLDKIEARLEPTEKKIDAQVSNLQSSTPPRLN